MKKKKLAVAAGCVMLYSWFASGAVMAETGAGGIEEVEVTASKIQDFTPIKLTVITAEDIKNKGAQNAAEALKDVAGLYITSGNAKGMAIAQIRGSNAENTKVFVDGVPLSQVGEAKVDLRLIPADNIAKIEVIRGAAPVIYGTDAPGGVIYITTKKADGKAAKSVSLATGSNNNYISSVTVAGESGKANYYIGIKQEKTDGYTDHARESAGYYNGKFSWDLGKADSLILFGSYVNRQEELPNRYLYTGSILSYPSGGGTVSGSGRIYSGTYDWEFDPAKQTYAGVLYSKKLDKDSKLNFKVYHSGESTLLNSVYEPQDKWLYVDWDGKINGYELQHVFKTGQNNTVTWGYAYETKSFTEGVSGAYISRADYDYTDKSLYIQNVAKIGSKLALSFGYRHDSISDHEKTYSQIGSFDDPGAAGSYDDNGDYTANKPVMSFNYALTDDAILHGSVGKSYRYPNARERCGGKYYISGSTKYYLPYLLPEEALNREVGLAYSTKFGLDIDFTYFNKDITNMIKSSNSYATFKDYYFNIPNVNMRGFEVEVSKKISDCVKGFFNYTYTNAYDTQAERQVADIPLRKFSFGLNYEGVDGLSANLAVNYIGQTKSMFTIGDGNGSGDSTESFDRLSWQMPSYHVVDLKVSKQLVNREYYFKISNLLDQQYYSGAWLLAPSRYVEAGTTVKF